MSTPAFHIEVGGDLELRAFEEADAVPLFALVEANRGHLREWLSWVDALTDVVQERAFISESDHALRRHQISARGYLRPAFSLGMFQTGSLIGAIGLVYIDYVQRSAEIGYWLAEGKQGDGIVTRSVSALVDYAFGVMYLHRVVIRCATGNTRSAAVPRRLGFTLEGTLREAEWLYDHWVDHHVFAMLQQDWPAHHG